MRKRSRLALRRGQSRSSIPDTSSKPAQDWPTEAHIRHLELIQSVVSRLAGNSFITKGWALTVAGAIYSFAASHLSPWIALAGLIPTIGFWWLDAYFLRQERLFRCLYDDARLRNTTVEPFGMHILIYKSRPSTRWPRVLFSLTLTIFYGMLVLAGVGFIAAGIIHEAQVAH
jgi:hypothetical protein